MSFLTLTVLATLLTLLCATVFAGEFLAREPVWLDDGRAALEQATRAGAHPDDRFPTTPVPWRGFQFSPVDANPAEKLRRDATRGDALAQFNLGLSYESGRGVAKDPALALKWFRRAAEQGYDEAQYTLGCCYNGDEGYPEDSGEAIKWWGRAATQGYADAQYCLGLSYYMGRGVPKDPAEATKWWGKAAEQDHANAQYFLGLCYHTGLGVLRHEKLALYWLHRAATHGNENARVALRNLGGDTEFPGRK